MGEKRSSQERREKPPLELGTLAHRISEYNYQHHGGAMLARFMLSGMELEDESKDEKEEKKEEKKLLTTEEIREEFKDVMAQTGISIEPVKGKMVLFSSLGPDEKMHSSEMRINLVDGRKFIQYLEGLNPETVSELDILGLEEVAKSLLYQLADEYDLTDSSDERMLELFGSLGKIIEHYHRLNPDKTKKIFHAIERLEEYLGIARQGYLREYMLAKKMQLLDEIGGNNFGPSKWHTDTSPESYEAKWLGVVEVIKEIRKNPKAGELRKTAIDNLRKSLEYAEDDIDSHTNILAEEREQKKRTIRKYREVIKDL